MTTPYAANSFLKPHINELSKNSEIFILTNYTDTKIFENFSVSIKYVFIPIERKINVLQDFKTLYFTYFIIKKYKFDLIISITPKAGIITSLAGLFAKVPFRVHIFTGQVWATRTGFSRLILKKIDQMIVKYSTNTLVDSHSQLSFLQKEKIINSTSNCRVIANGSICGVDLHKFKPNSFLRNESRLKLNIPSNKLLLLYLGRLKYDKGIIDLVNAFISLSEFNSDLFLLIVGPEEDLGIIDELNLKIILKKNIIIINDYTTYPEKYFTAADIFCMPSYREGFCSTVIEAAACGIPAVVSDVYGLSDAVDNNITGLQHKVGNVDSIIEKLNILIYDKNKRNQLGQNAQKRVNMFFSQEISVNFFINYISNLIKNSKA